MYGEYCRKYRMEKGATLKDIEGSDDIKALSAFEMGRSTNISHLLKYVMYANKNGDGANFMTGFAKVVWGMKDNG